MSTPTALENAAALELRRLHAENVALRAELAKEAARTASEKLRADQMTEQHRMQALKTSVPVQWLERFAQLVAAKAAADEREACARVVRDTKEWRAPGWVSTICPVTKESIAAGFVALKLVS